MSCDDFCECVTCGEHYHSSELVELQSQNVRMQDALDRIGDVVDPGKSLRSQVIVQEVRRITDEFSTGEREESTIQDEQASREQWSACLELVRTGQKVLFLVPSISEFRGTKMNMGLPGGVTHSTSFLWQHRSGGYARVISVGNGLNEIIGLGIDHVEIDHRARRYVTLEMNDYLMSRMQPQE